MIKFIKAILFGEPALFVGMSSAGLSAWQAALIAMESDVPLWLAIGTPVWIAAGAVFTRYNSEATNKP